MGSFSLDLNKYVIHTKLHWITRLTKLLKYLEHKGIRKDAIKPIQNMIRELKTYLLTRPAEDIDLDSRPESNRANSLQVESFASQGQSFRHLHVDSEAAKVRAVQPERR